MLKVISVEALITSNLTLMMLLAVFQNPLNDVYLLTIKVVKINMS